jgi:phosphoglycerate dehydrogenase-like enzyme
MSSTDILRVFISNSIAPELVTLMEEIEPRITAVWASELLAPRRRLGDHRGDPAFVRTAEQQVRFEQLMDSADALFGVPDESADALRRTVEANPRLRWVQTMAAGGGAQVKAAKLSDQELDSIVFTTSAGVHAGPLAEFALLGLLAGLKDLPRLRRAQVQHEWEPRWTMRHLGRQTVAVVGLGSIGRLVAKKLSLLGAKVIGVHRRQVEAVGVSAVFTMDEISIAVAQADAVVVALPGTAATAGSISATVLAALRPGTVFVNVGRGTVVDEAALERALFDGRVSFAALDVFATEPLATSSALWDLPNVLVSPHTAALDANEDRLIVELFASNARRLLDGEQLQNRVNTVEFY